MMYLIILYVIYEFYFIIEYTYHFAIIIFVLIIFCYIFNYT